MTTDPLLEPEPKPKPLRFGEPADDPVRRRELVERFVRRSLTGEGIDVDAAFEVRERGWTHELDED